MSTYDYRIDEAAESHSAPHVTADGETVTLYWDRQDPDDPGPAYRITYAEADGLPEESGRLEFRGWGNIHNADGRAEETEGYALEHFFSRPDGLYSGPDQHGVYPLFTY